MRVRKWFLSATGGLCLTFGIWTDTLVVAKAAIILTSPDADFSVAPYTIDFGGGAATYTFTDIYDPSTDPLDRRRRIYRGQRNGEFLFGTTDRFSSGRPGRRDWL